MKKSILITLSFSFCLSLVPLAFNACSESHFSSDPLKANGTVVTNPMSQDSHDMAAALCAVIQRCHSDVVQTECFDGVVNAQGVGAQFGLPSHFDTLSSISNAENSGLLISNSNASQTCSASLNSLTCNDPRVQTAYDAKSSNSFAGAANLISGSSCGGVFVSSVQYQCTDKVFVRGASNASNAPLASVGGMNFSVSPALPVGLVIDTHTGVISGNPTALMPITPFTITALGANGSISTSVHITVADGFLVNDLGDTNDQVSGDGMCATATGTCTLRAALAEANVSTGAPLDIVLPDGVILLTSSLSILKNVNIFGGCSNQTIVDGQGAHSLFHLDQPSLTVTMQGLKLQNGMSSNSSGAIDNGNFEDGSIFMGKFLNFFNNKSTNGSSGAVTWWGPNSEFHCSDCIFDSNQAPAGNGAAVYIIDKTNSFDRTLFVNNTGHQGAVGDYSSAGSSYANCTFYSNVGTVGSGGAYLNAASVNFNFVNTTFVNNRGQYAGALDGGGNINLANSILYNNTGVTGDCNRALISHGGNLSTSTAASCALNLSSDILGAANLGPLQNNGGFSNTLALLPGSPGINQAVNASCPSTDQRGLPRPAHNTCDTGAFEVQ